MHTRLLERQGSCQIVEVPGWCAASTLWTASTQPHSASKAFISSVTIKVFIASKFTIFMTKIGFSNQLRQFANLRWSVTIVVVSQSLLNIKDRKWFWMLIGYTWASRYPRTQPLHFPLTDSITKLITPKNNPQAPPYRSTPEGLVNSACRRLLWQWSTCGIPSVVFKKIPINSTQWTIQTKYWLLDLLRTQRKRRTGICHFLKR